MGVAWPISTKKKWKAIWDQDVHYIQYGGNCVQIPYISEVRAVLYYVGVHKYTESDYEQYELAYLGQYKPRGGNKRIYGTRMSII